MIAAGGTAGHVVPALAVADALRADGAEVSFVGGERAEARARARRGLRAARRSACEGLSRTQPARGRAGRAAGGRRAVARGAPHPARPAPDAVLGGGGYVAGPGRRWPRSLRRVPLVLTEADSHLGLTNRLLAPLARRVCLAFPIAGRDGRRATA